jgi:hypothetical protein
MPALGAGIHVLFVATSKTWMAGTSPAMTQKGLSYSILHHCNGEKAAGRKMSACCAMS